MVNYCCLIITCNEMISRIYLLGNMRFFNDLTSESLQEIVN